MHDHSTDGPVPIKEVGEEILERFGNISGIDVRHPPSAEEDGTMMMTVHTSEGRMGEFIEDSLPGSDVLLEFENGDRVRKPIWVQIDPDGPAPVESVELTKIFRPDTLQSQAPLSLEEGIERLRKKWSGVCPTCNDRTESILEHYRESTECSENHE